MNEIADDFRVRFPFAPPRASARVLMCGAMRQRRRDAVTGTPRCRGLAGGTQAGATGAGRLGRPAVRPGHVRVHEAPGTVRVLVVGPTGQGVVAQGVDGVLDAVDQVGAGTTDWTVVAERLRASRRTTTPTGRTAASLGGGPTAGTGAVIGHHAADGDLPGPRRDHRERHDSEAPETREAPPTAVPVPRLDAHDLLAGVPADRTDRPGRRPPAHPGALAVAGLRRRAAARSSRAATPSRSGASGVVLSQGTDTIEETAYLLDLGWDRPEPLVVTGAMRHASSPGADGPANLLAAVCVAAAPAAGDVACSSCSTTRSHAAGTVRKTHTSSTGAFASPGPGHSDGSPRGSPVFHAPASRGTRAHHHVAPLPPVALHRVSLDDDGRVLEALGDLGYRGAVIEGFGGGHVAERTLDAVRTLARRMPVVLASRTGAGPRSRRRTASRAARSTCSPPDSSPPGSLDGLKSRLLLAVLLAVDAPHDRVHAAFARPRPGLPPPRRP